MLLAEVHKPNGIRITKSDTDGIFIHFKGPHKQGGIELESLVKQLDFSGPIVRDWVEGQLAGKRTCHVEPYKDRWAVVFGEGMPLSPINFKDKNMANECANRHNEGKTIDTPIIYHLDECCGCSVFYFSTILQEIVVLCNECGMVRKGLFNNGDNDVSGATLTI